MLLRQCLSSTDCCQCRLEVRLSSFINRDPGMHIVYEIDLPDDPRRDFTAEEQALLRPIAETLAMLDGNAFFSMPGEYEREWYEQYLPQAWEVWHSNGGLAGWAGLASWAQDHKLRLTNATISGLWDQYQTAVKLIGGETASA